MQSTGARYSVSTRRFRFGVACVTTGSAAKDTADALKVDAALQAVDDQVVARERWLDSVEYDRG